MISHFRLEKIIKKSDRRRCQKETQRIAALVLFHSRGWTAERIARYFAWPRENVKRWLEAGISLDAGKPLK